MNIWLVLALLFIGWVYGIMTGLLVVEWNDRRHEKKDVAAGWDLSPHIITVPYQRVAGIDDVAVTYTYTPRDGVGWDWILADEEE